MMALMAMDDNTSCDGRGYSQTRLIRVMIVIDNDGEDDNDDYNDYGEKRYNYNDEDETCDSN